MYKHNPFKEIRFYYIYPEYNLISQLNGEDHSNTPQLSLSLLPEDLSNKSKLKSLDTYTYQYTFKLLQPSDIELVKLKKLTSKKCYIEFEDNDGNLLTIGNYDEPVNLSVSQIDNRNFKNIDGLKIKITCESLVLPALS